MPKGSRRVPTVYDGFILGPPHGSVGRLVFFGRLSLVVRIGCWLIDGRPAFAQQRTAYRPGVPNDERLMTSFHLPGSGLLN
jgi:hypothetical protein